MLFLSFATATAQAARTGQSLDRMVEYLQNDQNKDGGFGGEPGQQSDPGFTAWVALALAASGVNPRDQRRPERHAVTAFDYLSGEAAQKLARNEGRGTATTDFERELLVVDASGTSPHSFGGVDLVARILERELQESEAGGIAFPHEYGSHIAGMNDTIFAVLALSAVHEPAVEAAVQQAMTWIEREQNKDGSWPTSCPKTVGSCTNFGKEPEGEADMTAAAIEALNAAGRHNTNAQAKGLEYLHRTQNPSEGGFTERLGSRSSDADSSLEANIGTTAWVVQAIWAAGQSPEDWKSGGVDPLSYVESLQQPDGHVRFKRSEELNGVWMTAYSGTALAGATLPVPAAPYIPLPPEEPEASGSGGEGAQPGSDVNAGGGGNGARLFSRPQRGSKGNTPGGARVLAGKAAHSKQAQRRRNPGPPRRGAVPTLKTEAAGAESLPRANAEGDGARAVAGRRRSKPSTGAAARSRLSLAPATSRAAAHGQQVTGLPIGSLAAYKTALEPGAPGLRGAGRAPSSPVLAIAIAALALMLALAGSAVERSRPQVNP
ncbi:MAG: prenyltransferase/squalene oxidase repeat-containing protein [Solirubrobacteraceae bacterium]